MSASIARRSAIPRRRAEPRLMPRRSTTRCCIVRETLTPAAAARLRTAQAPRRAPCGGARRLAGQQRPVGGGQQVAGRLIGAEVGDADAEDPGFVARDAD